MEAVKPLMTLLLNNSKALLSRNNTVEILNNGEATFSSIFKAIAKAKNTFTSNITSLIKENSERN